MDIVLARRIVVKVNNYVKNEDVILNEELDSEVRSLALFIADDFLDRLADVFENGIKDNVVILKIISEYLNDDAIFKILKSNKLRNIFSDKEILVFWNKLDDMAKIEYINSSTYINKRDNFLVKELWDENLIKLGDIKDKISKNSLIINDFKNIDNSVDLLTGECLVEYLNKNNNKIKDFLDNKNVWMNVRDNAIILNKEVNIRDIFDNEKLLKKVNYKNLADNYGANKLVELYNKNKSCSFLGAIYLKDKLKFKKIVVEEFKEFENGFIVVNCYDLIKDNVDLKGIGLLKFSDNIILEIIDNFNSDEIIDMLRNKEFVREASSMVIWGLLSKLTLSNVFNFLQDIDIYNKVEELEFKINKEEKSLIIGFLDSYKLSIKLNKNMYYKLLVMLDYEEVSNFIVKPYILDNLSDEEIIDLLSIKNININNLIKKDYFFRRINKNILSNYIDKMWDVSVDFSLISDKRILRILFDFDDEELDNIRLEDTNYLLTTILNKEYLANVKDKVTVFSYKTIINTIKLFGVSNTLNILFNSLDGLKVNDVDDYLNMYVERKIKDLEILNNVSEYLKGILNKRKTFKKKDILENGILGEFFVIFEDIDELIKRCNRYIEYRTINENVAASELDEYCDSVLSKYFNLKKTEYTEEFLSNSSKILSLRSGILNKEKRLYNDNTLYNIKYKLLYAVYNNDGNYSYLFRKNINYRDKMDDFKKQIESYGFNFNDYLENIILPLSDNKFAVDKYLIMNNVEMPKDYEKYLEIIKEEELLKELNRRFIKLSYILSNKELKYVADYILYDSKIKIKGKLKNEVDFLKILVSDLKLEIYYDRRKNTFYSSNIINAYLDSDCEEFYERVKDVNNLIGLTKKFVRTNMLNNIIYKNYYNKFVGDFKKKIYSLDIKDYNIKRGIFTLKDLELTIGNLHVKEIDRLDDEYITYLNNIDLFPMIFSNLLYLDSSLVFTNYHKIIEYLRRENKKLEEIDRQEFLKLLEILN